MEAAVGIQFRIGAEGLHHGLLAGAGAVGSGKSDIAVRHDGVHIAAAAFLMGAEVAFVVRSHRAGSLPILLRVDENGGIHGGVNVQHRLKHLILHFDAPQSRVHALFIFARHDGNRIANIPDPPVQNQTVFGRWFRRGLARQGKAALRDILIGVDSHHALHFLGDSGVDLLNEGVGMGAAQDLHHQRVPGSNILQIHGLTQKELHGVLFAHGGIDGRKGLFLHAQPSFFHVR